MCGVIEGKALDEVSSCYGQEGDIEGRTVVA